MTAQKDISKTIKRKFHKKYSQPIIAEYKHLMENDFLIPRANMARGINIGQLTDFNSTSYRDKRCPCEIKKDTDIEKKDTIGEEKKPKGDEINSSSIKL